MLVPELAAGATAELAGLRAACADAIAQLVASRARSITVVGSWPGDSGPVRRQDPVVGSFAGFGVPVVVTPPRSVALAPQPLPLSLTVAAWLLREVGLPVAMAGVPGDLPPTECAAWTSPAPVAEPWGLLVMGDGSARRGVRAPGYDDPRAEGFDAAVAAALAAADTGALLGLDAGLAEQLWCAGRAPWQVLAAQVLAAGDGWSGELLYDAAPYGVAYFVATWSPPAPPPAPIPTPAPTTTTPDPRRRRS
jgi:hypothetical protein